MDTQIIHIPVMSNEVIEMLNIKQDGIYIDATVGLGGHSNLLLSQLNNSGILLAIDKDEDALFYAKERLNDKRALIKKGRFSQVDKIISDLKIQGVDGILFDLGVSMLQIRDFKRGFSFMSEEKLDMRMDKSQDLTAFNVVNNYSKEKLEKILWELGDEPLSRRIAKAIITNRRPRSINTCLELANLIKKIYPKRLKINPATKTFQAIRIEVNKELDELTTGLEKGLSILNKHGRMCIISYHSLEDRTVKNFFKAKEKEGVITILTKKPIATTREEIRNNPSSRSAKLRGCKKL